MKRNIKRRLISFVLLVATGSFYAFSVFNRVENGYFNDAKSIFIDGFAWVLFFGVVSGVVITELVNLTKK